MSYSSMNFGAMQQAYAAFQQKYAAMESELNDLEKSIEQKLGQWSDGAKDGYMQAKREWDNAAADIGKVMNQLGVVINSSSETGQSTVRTNQQLIG
ncbi:MULTISPECIES: WXG100 family type VII secretion target [Thermomonosporaceae]|uniref:WXG100 family type VII secretion target n=1 Tax=Thermomonosporaceae TaxID=2012 RepID=UPI00255AB4C0|nr:MULTISPECIES: WXG100 family type VII secretion target [Thermomonosporaceae]MDL4772856.1 WXG100 family type VII secretion target [Actinomadura xylanilytica]